MNVTAYPCTNFNVGLAICCQLLHLHIGGLVQERRNSIANTLELHLSCANPSNYVPLLSSIITMAVLVNANNLRSTLQYLETWDYYIYFYFMLLIMFNSNESALVCNLICSNLTTNYNLIMIMNSIKVSPGRRYWPLICWIDWITIDIYIHIILHIVMTLEIEIVLPGSGDPPCIAESRDASHKIP